MEYEAFPDAVVVFFVGMASLKSSRVPNSTILSRLSCFAVGNDVDWNHAAMLEVGSDWGIASAVDIGEY
jgi:hypothetical protein